MSRIGPLVMTAAGTEHREGVNIKAILWEGATTAGDTCELHERSTGNLLFAGRATGTQTWEGVVMSIGAPGGIRLSQISAGRVLVYLDEP